MSAHPGCELIRSNLSRVVHVVALEDMPNALETFCFHHEHKKFCKIQRPAVVDINGVNHWIRNGPPSEILSHRVQWIFHRQMDRRRKDERAHGRQSSHLNGILYFQVTWERLTVVFVHHFKRILELVFCQRSADNRTIKVVHSNSKTFPKSGQWGVWTLKLIVYLCILNYHK